MVVVEEDKFYITNSLWSLGWIGWMLELYGRVHWGDVVYFDGNKGHIVADGLLFTGGINISPDKK